MSKALDKAVANHKPAKDKKAAKDKDDKKPGKAKKAKRPKLVRDNTAANVALAQTNGAALVRRVGGKFVNVGGASRSEMIVRVLAWAQVAGAIRVEVAGEDVTIPTPDGWVGGWILCHPSIGGAGGDRRLRELVTARTVEKRLTTVGRDSSIEFRLIP